MKRITCGIPIVFLMLLFTGVAAAGDASDTGILERIEEQQKRIDQGIESGELSQKEAANVQAHLDKIKAKEARLKADGKLTPRQRASLNRELDRNNKRIFRKKHDARDEL